MTALESESSAAGRNGRTLRGASSGARSALLSRALAEAMLFACLPSSPLYAVLRHHASNTDTPLCETQAGGVAGTPQSADAASTDLWRGLRVLGVEDTGGCEPIVLPRAALCRVPPTYQGVPSASADRHFAVLLVGVADGSDGQSTAAPIDGFTHPNWRRLLSSAIERCTTQPRMTALIVLCAQALQQPLRGALREVRPHAVGSEANEVLGVSHAELEHAAAVCGARIVRQMPSSLASAEAAALGSASAVAERVIGRTRFIVLHADTPEGIPSRTATLVLRAPCGSLVLAAEQAVRQCIAVVTKAATRDAKDGFLPGGGSCELGMSEWLRSHVDAADTEAPSVCRAFASALEAITLQLLSNIGVDAVSVAQQMRRQMRRTAQPHATASLGIPRAGVQLVSFDSCSAGACVPAMPGLLIEPLHAKVRRDRRARLDGPSVCDMV